MHVTTARTAAGSPERGRALDRLLADIDALDSALDPHRPAALERLEQQLGSELTRKLVSGLSSGAGRLREVRAA